MAERKVVASAGRGGGGSCFGGGSFASVGDGGRVVVVDGVVLVARHDGDVDGVCAVTQTLGKERGGHLERMSLHNAGHER